MFIVMTKKQTLIVLSVAFPSFPQVPMNIMQYCFCDILKFSTEILLITKSSVQRQNNMIVIHNNIHTWFIWQ